MYQQPQQPAIAAPVEDHSASAAATPANAAADWGDTISDERKAELDALQVDFVANPGNRSSPFASVRLTGADVFCLAACALAGADGDVGLCAEQLRQARQDAGLRLALDLSALHLGGADLQGASLEGAALRGAHLRGANLWCATLRRANLQQADLEGADLRLADLRLAHLAGARLRNALLEQANLGAANLAGAALRGAKLTHAVLVLAHLEGASLRQADLDGANLAEASLERAFLAEARVQGANLYKARLQGANFTRARLQGANLRQASFDKATFLGEAELDRAALAHVGFNGADLTTLFWNDVGRLGDEVEARRPRSIDVVRTDDWHVERTGQRKARWQQRDEYTQAARAYRALSVELRAQGLSREATRFHYRSQLMDRHALLYDGLARATSAQFYTTPWAFGRWLVSWLLGTFAGYGDYMSRLFATYLLVVLGFAAVFLARQPEPITVPSAINALVLSITAFHGHGLAAPGITMTRGMVWLAGMESFLGLVLEGLFVAAFTRRLLST